MSTLITFLGKGQAHDGGYRKACYCFADDQTRETSYFGLALADVENVATVRILGTSGSMWDALILEQGDTQGEDERWEELASAVAADRVDQPLLDAVERMLNRNDQRKFELRLIPYGVNDEEQVAILLAITQNLPRDQGIILDITHALRHLPMLGLLSVFYLRAVTKIRIDAIYYGALEQTQDNRSPLGILTHDAVDEILIEFPEHSQCRSQTERKKRRQNRCQIQSFDAALLQVGDDGKSKHREQSGTQGMLEGIPFGNRVIEPAKTAQQERQIEKHGIDEGDSLR